MTSRPRPERIKARIDAILSPAFSELTLALVVKL
jgi:hypothetical protein